MLFFMSCIAPFIRASLFGLLACSVSSLVMAQAQSRINSINVDGANAHFDAPVGTRAGTAPTSGNAEKASTGLFPIAPTSLETHSNGAPAPTRAETMNGAAASSHYPAATRIQARPTAPAESDSTPDFSIPPLPLRATNVIAGPNPKIRWLLFQSSERSANTGQLTCLGWARSINLAKALEAEGPFNAAVASASVREDLSIGSFWNNAAEATIVPLASKWDAPVWALAPADAPMDALSALYQFSKSATGSANIAVSWDGEYLERFQAAWLEGLVKSGDMDGLQAFSWKQKIRKWSANDKSRIDVLEYTVESGKLKNVQWRTMNLRFSGPNYGCPTS